MWRVYGMDDSCKTSRLKRGRAAFLILILLALIAVVPVGAMLNPATVYCQAMGYNWTIQPDARGGAGYCILPQGKSVGEWDFIRGSAGQEYSYCARKGYKARTIKDSEKCSSIASNTCMVCILQNGTEVQVTDLMNLSFEETRCGDGSCGLPETLKTCPQDCRSGSWDGFCDGKFDGKCDRDCTATSDVDCLIRSPFFIGGVLVILGIAAGYYLLKHRKQKDAR